MSANRLHAGLLEIAARELDRSLRALTPGETFRAEYLRDHIGQLQNIARVSDGGVEVRGRLLWLKRAVRRVLRPYLAHLSRVDRMLIDRMHDLTEAVNQTNAALSGLREEIRADLDYQEDRLRNQFLRGRSMVDEGASAGRIRLAGSSDLAEIPDGARLLLGSTAVPQPGYLRVAPEDAAADLSAPLDAIPARAGSVSEIVVVNVLEDYPAAEVRQVLLPHWASLLKPGGRIALVADDLGAAADRLRDGQLDPERFAEALFGDGGRPRRSAYTPEMLRRMAEDAGLVQVRVCDRAQRPDAGLYGFKLTAAVPAA